MEIFLPSKYQMKLFISWKKSMRLSQVDTEYF